MSGNVQIFKSNYSNRPRAKRAKFLSFELSMNLIYALATLTSIFVIEFLTNFGRSGRLVFPPPVEACLPRIPNIWSWRWSSAGKDAKLESKYSERSQWTTNDWIEKNKYALELHNVTTKDGYELQLQRLPRPGKRPVLLVHGLLTSSLSWVLMGPGKSLAFLLYDKNYDVWLANLRGSAYGRSHTRLTASDVDFWNFSFHEHGTYDLPAIVDHIRHVSAFRQVLLIAHSQAFNAILALLTERPEYNDCVQFVQALAPLAQLKDVVNLEVSQVKKIIKFIRQKRKAQKHEIYPPGKIAKQCLRKKSEKQRECLDTFQMIAGVGQHSRSLDPLLFGNLLHGGSVKEVTHLYQLWFSGDFVSFDYGPIDNVQHYNSVEPRIYDLRLLKVPMVLHFGDSDAIATPDGVRSIYSRLIDSDVVRGVYQVAAEYFNHVDFVMSNNVRGLINDKVIEIMEKFLKGELKYVIE